MKHLLSALVILAFPLPGLAQDQAPGGGEGRSSLAVERHALGARNFSLATGFDFSSGKYGTGQSTDILYIPVTAKYETEKLMLKLTVPYIRVSGPVGVTYGIGPTGQAMAMPRYSTDAGLGDILTSAGYTVYDDGELALDIVGKIKFGTANTTTGLGTGKNDYAAQLDGDYTRDKTSLFATVGYKVYGSPPGETLRNVPYGTVGAARALDGNMRAGAMLYMKQSPSVFSGNQREATLFFSTRISPQLKLQADASRGFATGSPDFSFGAMVTRYF